MITSYIKTRNNTITINYHSALLLLLLLLHLATAKPHTCTYIVRYQLVTQFNSYNWQHTTTANSNACKNLKRSEVFPINQTIDHSK